MKDLNRRFDEIWLVDFEFSAPPGEKPSVVCMVALEIISGRKLRKWGGELELMSTVPFSLRKDSLYVAYYSSAEFSCHLALGWPLPTNVLDLFVEFRNLTNGRTLICGAGLLGALAWFGLNSIEAAEKGSMRDLIMRGGPWTAQEKEAILDYCESDVKALSRLLPAMLPHLDLSRALLRGGYLKAAAHIEFNGVPIDTETLNKLRDNWDGIQERLIASVDSEYAVFEGKTFKAARFAEWLADRAIPWPLLPSGKLSLTDDSFKQMARSYPEIAPLRELRVALSQMRLSKLAVGSDGRNRCLLSAFRARTGRNQPSNSKFIFGPAVWLRSLIKPTPGYGLAYVDWNQQEFGIAAALSGDEAMKEAYLTGDPYLAFAKQAGAVPPDATKKSHAAEREQYKACVLAVQYGMGIDSLAQKIRQPRCQAKDLLDKHKQMYREFWKWSEAAVDYGMLYGKLWTTYGWTVHSGDNPNPRFLGNFLMQGNGAEMLRLACCFLTQSGIRVCAPIHDAVLIEAPLKELDDTICETQALMAKASRVVLSGFELGTDVDVIRYPDRYKDVRGTKMWETVQGILHELDDTPELVSRPGRERNVG
jgi:DNA polymerase-1